MADWLSPMLVLVGTIISNLVIYLKRGDSLALRIYERRANACEKVLPHALSLLDLLNSYLGKKDSQAAEACRKEIQQTREELWAALTNNLSVPKSVGIEVETALNWSYQGLKVQLPLHPDDLLAKRDELHEVRLKLFNEARRQLGVDLTDSWVRRILDPLSFLICNQKKSQKKQGG